MSKMNPEIKARWIAALRSGEYKQGTGCLRDDLDLFCCIGVLCDLADHSAWVQSSEDSVWSFKQHGAYDLPLSTEKAALGLDWDKAQVSIDGEMCTLVDHNDQGRSFAEIADAIEAQL